MRAFLPNPPALSACQSIVRRPDAGDGDHFGYSVAVAGDMACIGASLATVDALYRRGDASVFALGLPASQLTVDDSFCATRGVANFSGDCIAAALEEAELRPGAIATVVLEPGLYTRGRRGFHFFSFSFFFIYGESAGNLNFPALLPPISNQFESRCEQATTPVAFPAGLSFSGPTWW